MFTLNNSELSDRYRARLAEIPLACITTADQITTLASQHLPGELHNIIYIKLTDHIHFALQRHAQGFDIKNALLWEIEKLYPAEFDAGLEATLPEDEASFIGLHFFNSQPNDEMHITRVM